MKALIKCILQFRNALHKIRCVLFAIHVSHYLEMTQIFVTKLLFKVLVLLEMLSHGRENMN